MSVTFSFMQQRRDVAADWTSNNPILSQGEIGFELDTFKLKIGDGATHWNSLDYIGGTVNPGSTPTNATAGSILFSDGSTVAQNNTGLYWDDSSITLKLVDKTYVPSISLSTVPNFTVGSTTATNSSSHYLGEAHEFTVNQSGDGKFIYGEFHKLRISGSYTNTNVVGVQYVFDNRTSFQSGTGLAIGMDVFMNCESTTQTVYGATITAGAGGSGASGIETLVGIWGVGFGGHNGHQDNVTGIKTQFMTPDSGLPGSVTTAKCLDVLAHNETGNTVHDLMGISISDWINIGAVTNSYAIYIDNTVGVGNTNYALYSLSTAPSLITGDLTLSSKFILPTPSAPASAGSTGTTGQIAWDSGFVYVCTATNTWKRAAIATW